MYKTLTRHIFTGPRSLLAVVTETRVSDVTSVAVAAHTAAKSSIFLVIWFKFDLSVWITADHPFTQKCTLWNDPFQQNNLDIHSKGTSE